MGVLNIASYFLGNTFNHSKKRKGKNFATLAKFTLCIEH